MNIKKFKKLHPAIYTIQDLESFLKIYRLKEFIIFENNKLFDICGIFYLDILVKKRWWMSRKSIDKMLYELSLLKLINININLYVNHKLYRNI